MIDIIFTNDTGGGTARLVSPTTIKSGGTVPVRVTFSSAAAVSLIQLALGSADASSAVLAFTETFTQENATTWTGTLDASDTRLVTFVTGKGPTNVNVEVVCTIDGVPQAAANLSITVQPAIITGPETSEGGPTYLTTGAGDARYIGVNDVGTTPGTVAAGNDARFVQTRPNFATDQTRPVLPLSGNLYAFGDSQTYGTNASGNSYTSGGRLLSAYQWPNILGAAGGRSLTVNNLGVPGSKISVVPGFVGGTWNETGQLAFDWTGVATLMAGFNNTDGGTTTDAFFDRIEHTYRAMIARFLIDDFAGIGTNGWGHTGSSGGTLNGFTSNGSQESTAVAAPANRAYPLYYGDASGNRLRVDLSSGQTIQFTLTNKRACALFFESNSGGGAFTVAVNGVEVATGNTNYTNVGGNDFAGQVYPQVVWLDNLFPSSAITITAGSSTVYFVGYGWVERQDASRVGSKTVLLGPGTANAVNGRTEATLLELNRRGLAVVGEFPGYPVYFANVYDAWVTATDQEPSDISHFTPSGGAHVAAAFGAASKPPHAAIQGTSNAQKFQALTGFTPNRIHIPFGAGWAETDVGSGQVTATQLNSMRLWAQTTTGSSVLVRHVNNTLNSIMLAGGNVQVDGIPWSGRVRCKFRFSVNNLDINTVQRFKLGDVYSNTLVNDLGSIGIGLKIANTSLMAMVHNGTVGSVSSAIATLSPGGLYEVIMDSDGAGNLQIYLNGAPLAPVTGAPIIESANNQQVVSFSTSNGPGTQYAVLDLMGDVQIILG